MNLSELSLLDLLKHMSHAEKQWLSPSTSSSYMEYAREDMPIIDELIDQIELMLGDKSLPHRKQLIRQTHSTIMILLALRRIEHEQHSKAVSPLLVETN